MGAQLQSLRKVFQNLHVDAVASLSEREQTILHLHLVLNIDFDDIAEVMELTVEGVEKRYFRAMYLVAERVCPEVFNDL